MGIFGSILGGLGDIAKFASPVAALIPGVGPLAAAGIGAAGGALGKLNDPAGERGLGDILGSAAGGAALGGGAGLASQAAGGPRGLIDMIKANPMQALQLGGAGLSAIQGSRQQAKVNKLIEEELERQRREQERAGGFQDILQEQLGSTISGLGQRPDLSGLFAGTSNPFAQVGAPPGLAPIPGATQATAPTLPGQQPPGQRPTFGPLSRPQRPPFERGS